MKNKKRHNTPPAVDVVDLVVGRSLAPVLELVRQQSVPGLDDLELEILAEQQAQFPALPDPGRCAPTSFGTWATAAGMAS